MQFERVATQYQPRTAADVIATARLVKQRQMHRDALACERRRAAIAEKHRQRLEAEARAALITKWTVERYRLVVDIQPAQADVVADQPAVQEPKRITIAEVTDAACVHFSISKIDILSARRERKVVFPRQVAMYLSKVLTLRSLPKIGRRFGGRDHTTVLHAVGKITALLAAGDEQLASDVAAIKRALGVA